MAELLALAKTKENIIPCLNDAHFPGKYRIQANNPKIIFFQYNSVLNTSKMFI